MGATCIPVSLRPEKGIRFPRTGITLGCEHMMCVSVWGGVLEREPGPGDGGAHL